MKKSGKIRSYRRSIKVEIVDEQKIEYQREEQKFKRRQFICKLIRTLTEVIKLFASLVSFR